MYNFDALISRLKYIPRWSLMRSLEEENVAEHSFQTAVLAHTLGLLGKNLFGRQINCEKLALCGLYHDVCEILTGDMPTPVKYGDEKLESAYKETESRAFAILCGTAHPSLQSELIKYMTGRELTEYEKKLLKAADKISALSTCAGELASGNREFESAYKSTLNAIKEMELEEAEFFLENMAPSFRQSLDELCDM